MDGFSYYNLFDTKGMEYIVIIAFLLLFIPFWLILNKNDRVKRGVRKAIDVVIAGVLRVPQGIYHSKNHTWMFLEKMGTAKIGLNDLLLYITGDVNVKYHRKDGEQIKKGDLIAEVESMKKSLKVFSPISGKIINANDDLQTERDTLTNDPYGKGWIYRIKPSDWKKEVSAYYLAEETNNWLSKELDRYKDFVAMKAVRRESSATPVLQDGGELSKGSLSTLSVDAWDAFQEEFLNQTS